MASSKAPRPRARAPLALRQTEDALLDLHQECKLSRQALRRQAEQLRLAQEAISAEREHAAVLQQDLLGTKARSEAIEAVFALELRAVERELPSAGGEANLRRQLKTLRNVAAEAVSGMEEARAECEWLHTQLRSALQSHNGTTRADVSGAVWMGQLDGCAGGVPCSGADASAMTVASHLGGSQRSIGGGCAAPAEGSSLLVARDDSALEAARADFARAVQRCHTVQVRQLTRPPPQLTRPPPIVLPHRMGLRCLRAGRQCPPVPCNAPLSLLGPLGVHGWFCRSRG